MSSAVEGTLKPLNIVVTKNTRTNTLLNANAK
jgi:hypothetical protein